MYVIIYFVYRAVKVLLESGADPNVQDEFSTPFKTAARQHKRVMEGKFFLLHLNGQ